jgi:SpoVK/Ycf46/Vps4 family AAA+-type ATPase
MRKKQRIKLINVNKLPKLSVVIDENALDKNGKWIIRKSILYLRRLLQAKSLYDYNTFEFIFLVLGPKEREFVQFVLTQMKTSLARDEFLEERVGADDLDDLARLYKIHFFHLKKDRQSLFMKEIIRLMGERYSSLKYRGLSEIEKHINSMAKMFCLPKDDRAFYDLLFLHSVSSKAESYFVDAVNVHSIMKRKYLCLMLNMSNSQVSNLLSGTLAAQGILKHDSSYLCLTDEFMEFFKHSVGTVQKKNLYRKISGDTLPLSYHLIKEEDTSHLLSLYQGSTKNSTHVLLYGPPGTGKSSFAEALATHLTPNSFKILQGVGNDGKNRRSAIVACMNMTSFMQDRIIVVDEADNLLNTQHSWFSRGETQDKGWLNQLMEKPGVKVIWIVNLIEDIESSVIRRFAYSIHFRSFNRQQRIQLWERILRQNKMKRFFSDFDIKNFAGKYKLSAGVVDLAIKKAFEISTKSKKTIHRAVQLSLDAHLTLVNDGDLPVNKEIIGHSYSLEGLNIKGDINMIVGRLEKFSEYLNENPSEILTMNLLFYGPPGTGKSELGRYIAHRLDREILCKRVSDLQDKYVGEGEKNIKNAFQEAERENAVLIIDEADSLLYSREKSRNSWEVSFTNEFLTQMERFRGILICTTNRFEELDPASIRRFNYKLHFQNLTPHGNTIFYHKMLSALVPTSFNESHQNTLERIQDLSPGDFKTVYERCRFYPSIEMSHELLLQSLSEESTIKQQHGHKKTIGFM